MSEITTAARPYAKAVFELANGAKNYEQWDNTLAFLSAVAADEQVRPLLTTPALRAQERGEAFLKVCEGNVDEQGANFVRVLAENGRLPLLPAIAELYQELSGEAQNIVDVTVRSAFELSDEQSETIKKALSEKLGKSVTINAELDESLVGGIVIRAGDLVMDGSVKNRINQLANQLLS